MHLQIFKANPHASSATEIISPKEQDGIRMNNSQEFTEGAKVDVLSSSGGTGGDSHRIINEAPLEHESDNEQIKVVEEKKSRSALSQISCVSLSASDEDAALLLTIHSERCDKDKNKHK